MLVEVEVWFPADFAKIVVPSETAYSFVRVALTVVGGSGN